MKEIKVNVGGTCMVSEGRARAIIADMQEQLDAPEFYDGQIVEVTAEDRWPMSPPITRFNSHTLVRWKHARAPKGIIQLRSHTPGAPCPVDGLEPVHVQYTSGQIYSYNSADEVCWGNTTGHALWKK